MVQLRRECAVDEVATAMVLDSSFAASTASTRLDGDREGGGGETEGADSFTEEDGTLDESPSSSSLYYFEHHTRDRKGAQASNALRTSKGHKF